MLPGILHKPVYPSNTVVIATSFPTLPKHSHPQPSAMSPKKRHDLSPIQHSAFRHISSYHKPTLAVSHSNTQSKSMSHELYRTHSSDLPTAPSSFAVEPVRTSSNREGDLEPVAQNLQVAPLPSSSCQQHDASASLVQRESVSPISSMVQSRGPSPDTLGVESSVLEDSFNGPVSGIPGTNADGTTENEAQGQVTNLANCPSCKKIVAQNDHLRHQVSKLTYKLQKASEIQQTYGQRLLRLHYERKIKEFVVACHKNTLRLLSYQKKKNEKDWKQLSESLSSETALRKKVEEECVRKSSYIATFEREHHALKRAKEEAVTTMLKKLAQVCNRNSHLERQNARLKKKLVEKDVLHKSLKAAAKVENGQHRDTRVPAMVSNSMNTQGRNREASLETEMRNLRHQLSAALSENSQLLQKIKTIEQEKENDRIEQEEVMAELHGKAQRELNQLSSLIGSVIQDFASSQISAESTADANTD